MVKGKKCNECGSDMPWFPYFKGWRELSVEGKKLLYCPNCYQLADKNKKIEKAHPETIKALEILKKDFENGRISIESDTWRLMANKHTLDCIQDDIQHERISSEDASLLKKYDNLSKNWRNDVITSFKDGHKGVQKGECTGQITVNAPIKFIWDSWRNIGTLVKTLPDATADRIDDTHYWIKQVDPEKGDTWFETYKEVELVEPLSIVTEKIEMKVQAMGMDDSLQEINLEGKWIDYTQFEEITNSKTKITFKATFTPYKPITDYGQIFLTMFTQTNIHPTMNEEIKQQLKKFKALVEK